MVQQLTLLYETKIPYVKKSSFVTRGFFYVLIQSGRARTLRRLRFWVSGWANGGETETEERDREGRSGPGVLDKSWIQPICVF